MEEKELCAAARQKIKFGRVARQCLKHLAEVDKESLLKKYEEQEKRYLKVIEELKAQLMKPIPINKQKQV
jgi:hypothetical protein